MLRAARVVMIPLVLWVDNRNIAMVGINRLHTFAVIASVSRMLMLCLVGMLTGNGLTKNSEHVVVCPESVLMTTQTDISVVIVVPLFDLLAPAIWQEFSVFCVDDIYSRDVLSCEVLWNEKKAKQKNQLFTLRSAMWIVFMAWFCSIAQSNNRTMDWLTKIIRNLMHSKFTIHNPIQILNLCTKGMKLDNKQTLVVCIQTICLLTGQ